MIKSEASENHGRSCLHVQLINRILREFWRFLYYVLRTVFACESISHVTQAFLIWEILANLYTIVLGQFANIFSLASHSVLFSAIKRECMKKKYKNATHLFRSDAHAKHRNINRNLENIGRKIFSEFVVVCTEIRSFAWKSGCGWRSCEQLVNYDGIIHAKFFTRNRSYKINWNEWPLNGAREICNLNVKTIFNPLTSEDVSGKSIHYAIPGLSFSSFVPTQLWEAFVANEKSSRERKTQQEFAELQVGQWKTRTHKSSACLRNFLIHRRNTCIVGITEA